MTEKIYLTMIIIFMSVQSMSSQHIIYGDQDETKTDAKYEAGDEKEPAGTTATYYVVDEIIPNTFTTGNNLLIVCRLLPDGKDNSVVCSTAKPKNGWGSIVSNDSDDSFSYKEYMQQGGASIYSMAFTDPENGWAVGVMNSHSINSGVIFRTSDGGKKWSLQYSSGTDMMLQAVGFTSPDNGWVNGKRTVGNSTFKVALTTDDGGFTWQEKAYASANDVLAGTALNSND